MKSRAHYIQDNSTRTTRDDVLDAAARFGFVLVNFSTPSGQTVWEWRRGEGPRPQFITERMARQWMSNWIEQFVSAMAARQLPSRVPAGAGRSRPSFMRSPSWPENQQVTP